MPKLSEFRDFDTFKPDGRTKQARLAKSFRQAVTENLGEPLSLAQRVRVNMACSLQTRLSQISVDVAPHEYIRVATALNRLLDELGLADSLVASQ